MKIYARLKVLEEDNLMKPEKLARIEQAVVEAENDARGRCHSCLCGSPGQPDWWRATCVLPVNHTGKHLFMLDD